MPEGSKTIQSESERRLLYALACMCEQYLGEVYEEKRVLDHMFMHAGEEAFEQLAVHGLIEDGTGRIASWTAKGQALLSKGPAIDREGS